MPKAHAPQRSLVTPLSSSCELWQAAADRAVALVTIVDPNIWGFDKKCWLPVSDPIAQPLWFAFIVDRA